MLPPFLNKAELEMLELSNGFFQRAATLDVSQVTAKKILDDEHEQSKERRYGFAEAVERAKGRLVDIYNIRNQVADKVAERLEGQALGDIEQYVEEIGDELGLPVEERDRQTLLRRIDDKIFCCNSCGWWCSTDELNNETDEDLCDDCNGTEFD